MDNIPLISTPPLQEAPQGNTEGAIVPVVVGQVKVEGNIAYVGSLKYSSNLTKLKKFGDMTTGYIAAVWYVISTRIDKLKRVFANDKPLMYGTDYDDDHINLGDGSYAPTVPPMPVMVTGFSDGVACAKAAYSYDQTNWTQADLPDMYLLKCLISKGRLYLAGGGTTTDETTCLPVVYISNNGIDWEKITLPISGSNKSCVTAIIWGSGKFTAVGTNGHVWTSERGFEWTEQTTGLTVDTYNLRAIATNGAWFLTIAYGKSGEAVNQVLTSVDGITWTKADMKYSPSTNFIGDITGICYAQGKFIAVSANGYILTSITGLSGDWNRYAGLSGTMLFTGVAGNPYTIVATGYSGGGAGYIAYSNDTTAWTSYPFSTYLRLNCIVWNNAKFWVGGNNCFASSELANKVGAWTITTSPSSFGAILAVIYDVVGANLDYVTKLKGLSHIFFHPVDGSSGTALLDERVVFDSSGKAPDMKFVVIAGTPTYGEDNQFVYRDTKLLGVTPPALLYEILANAQWGLGIPAELIDKESFQIYAQIFADEVVRAYGLNLAITDIMTAQELIDKIRDLTDMFINWEDRTLSGTPKFTCKSTYYLDYGKTDKKIYDKDLLGCQVKIQSWNDVYNTFEGEYIEPNLNFERRSVYVKNEAAIAMVDGRIKKKKIDLTWFNDIEIASARLHEVMQRESFPRTTISCDLPLSFSLFAPGDMVIVESDEYNIHGGFMVTQISYGELNSMKVSIDLQPVFYELFDGNYKSVLAGQMVSPPINDEFLSYQVLTFGAYESLSSVRTGDFTVLDNVRVRWHDHLVMKTAFREGDSAMLVQGTDYTVYGNGSGTPAIQLDEDKWDATIRANSQGLLAIDVWEEGV